jgi:hypothetical protein
MTSFYLDAGESVEILPRRKRGGNPAARHAEAQRDDGLGWPGRRLAIDERLSKKERPRRHCLTGKDRWPLFSVV